MSDNANVDDELETHLTIVRDTMDAWAAIDRAESIMAKATEERKGASERLHELLPAAGESKGAILAILEEHPDKMLDVVRALTLWGKIPIATYSRTNETGKSGEAPGFSRVMSFLLEADKPLTPSALVKKIRDQHNIDVAYSHVYNALMYLKNKKLYAGKTDDGEWFVTDLGRRETQNSEKK